MELSPTSLTKRITDNWEEHTPDVVVKETVPSGPSPAVDTALMENVYSMPCVKPFTSWDVAVLTGISPLRTVVPVEMSVTK